MHVYVGLDLGTSSLKAVALATDGRLVASASHAYPTHSPVPGWAEQDPADWTQAAHVALRELSVALPRDAEPRALGIAAQLPTLALLDPDGRPLRPAIVWYDGRATAQATAMLRALPAEEWYRRSGIVFDAHYLAPMHAWVAEHEPDALARGAYLVCGAKDALLHALTGRWLSDPTMASGVGVYNPRDGAWDEALLRAAGLTTALLPPLASPWTVAGRLGSDWRHTGLPDGLPVVVGAADSLCGVLGCGATESGVMAVIAGTSTAMLMSTRQPLYDQTRRFFLTPHAVPQRWALEMDLMATGSSVRWLADLLGLADPAALDTLAARSPIGARGVVGLPYLAGGEQGALWDRAARGALTGFGLSHGPADLARALCEGIAFEMRRCLLAWLEADVAVDEVILSGASGTNFFTALVAAVLQRPVRLTATGSTSARGAALLAGVGVGAWSADMAAGIARHSLGQPIIPDAADSAQYVRLYEHYDAVSRALRQIPTAIA